MSERQPPPARPEPLIRLGLSPLEAEVYAFLLQEAPATGYRVAQALGRPFAGVYKTLEALERKGAVLTADDGENRVARAVPVRELLRRFTHEFREQRSAAYRALAGLERRTLDDRVYELRTHTQLLERARTMIRRARTFVIAACCPAPLDALHDEFVAAAVRGVAVGLKTFAPAEIAGATVVVDPRGLAALETGPGQWIQLSADGRELVSGLLSTDGQTLHYGYSSASALLAWNTFTGLSSDFVLAAIRNAIRDGASVTEIASLTARLAPFETPRSVGKRSLIRRFRAAARPHRRKPVSA